MRILGRRRRAWMLAIEGLVKISGQLNQECACRCASIIEKEKEGKRKVKVQVKVGKKDLKEEVLEITAHRRARGRREGRP